MKKDPQNNRKKESGPQDFNLFPARDYNRWAYLINEVAEMAGASKYDQYQLIKKAADFVKANPGATIHERELFLEKLMESLPISWELAEGEAYLLLQGLQSISFGEIAGSTNATYLHYMGLVLQAGELAARRLRVAIGHHQSQLLSESSHDESQPETEKLPNDQSAQAASGHTSKEAS